MPDDRARPREPDAVGARMLDDIAQDPAKLGQTVRLADDEGMKRERVAERLLHALLEHLVDLVDDHVGELPRRMVPVEHRRRVVELHRVGYGKDPPAAGLQPHRLVVHRPVQDIAVAVLLERVERGRGLGNPRPQPPPGRFALPFREKLGRLADQDRFLFGRQIPLPFAVGPPVADDLVAAGADALDDLRRVVVGRGVHQMAGGKAELVEQVENPPDADAQPVIAPSVVSDVGLRARGGRGMSHPFPVMEMLDVEADIEGEPLAARPVVVRAIDDRRIVVTAVVSQLHPRPPDRYASARRYTVGQGSGTTAVASISTFARSSMSAETSTAAIAGQVRPHHRAPDGADFSETVEIFASR